MRRSHSGKELPIERRSQQREMRPMLWDPMRGMSELFEDFFGGFSGFRDLMSMRTLEPRVNINEDDREYVITAALPGIKKEDVRVHLQDGVLAISGTHREEREEKGKNFLKRELGYGSFQRSFILPAGVHPENVKAEHKDGILTIRLPKEERSQSRGIEIKLD